MGAGVAAGPGGRRGRGRGAEVQPPGARRRPLGPARRPRPLLPGGAGLPQRLSPVFRRPASSQEPDPRDPPPRASESAGGAGGGGGEEPVPSAPRPSSPGRGRKFLFPEAGSAGTLPGAARFSFLRAARPGGGGGALRGGPTRPPPPCPEPQRRAAGTLPSAAGSRPCGRPGRSSPGRAGRAPLAARARRLGSGRRGPGGGDRGQARQWLRDPQGHASPLPFPGRNGGALGLPASGEGRARETAPSLEPRSDGAPRVLDEINKEQD